MRLYTLPDDTVIDLDKLSAVGSVAYGNVLVDGKLIHARLNVDERRALLDAWRESGRRPMEELEDVSELAGDTADRLFALESDVQNLRTQLDALTWFKANGVTEPTARGVTDAVNRATGRPA